MNHLYNLLVFILLEASTLFGRRNIKEAKTYANEPVWIEILQYHSF